MSSNSGASIKGAMQSKMASLTSTVGRTAGLRQLTPVERFGEAAASAATMNGAAGTFLAQRALSGRGPSYEGENNVDGLAKNAAQLAVYKAIATHPAPAPGLGAGPNMGSASGSRRPQTKSDLHSGWYAKGSDGKSQWDTALKAEKAVNYEQENS